MRFVKIEHVYEHNWETVTSAFWVKYPNPFQQHVKRVDTLESKVDKENGIIYLWRLMSLNYSVPRWISKLMNASGEGFGFEEIACDLNKKILTLNTRNITFSNLFSIKEVCIYSQHPENPNWTYYTQHATYFIPCLGYAGQAIEKIAAQNAYEKASKGLKAMAKKILLLEDYSIKDSYDKVKEMANQNIGLYSSIVDSYFNSYFQFAHQELFEAFSYYHRMKRELMNYKLCLNKKAYDVSTLALQKYEESKQAYNAALTQLETKLMDLQAESLDIFSNFDPVKHNFKIFFNTLRLQFNGFSLFPVLKFDHNHNYPLNFSLKTSEIHSNPLLELFSYFVKHLRLSNPTVIENSTNPSNLYVTSHHHPFSPSSFVIPNNLMNQNTTLYETNIFNKVHHYFFNLCKNISQLLNKDNFTFLSYNKGTNRLFSNFNNPNPILLTTITSSK